LAVNVFQRPSIEPLIQIASFTILAGALIAAAQSTFIGIEKMGLNSVTLILQSCFKTALMSIFIILGLGTFGAVLGMTMALLIAGLICILMLLKLYKNLEKSSDEDQEFWKIQKSCSGTDCPYLLQRL